MIILLAILTTACGEVTSNVLDRQDKCADGSCRPYNYYLGYAEFLFNGDAINTGTHGADGQLGSIQGTDSSDPATTSDRFSNENSALEFDGVDDFIELNNVMSLSRAFELSFWIQANDTSSRQTIITDEYHNVHAYIESNKIYAYVRESGDEFTVSMDYTDNKWNHINISFERNYGLSIKVNDGYMTNEYITNNYDGIISSENWTIGRFDNSTAYYFNGKIDELKIVHTEYAVSEFYFDFFNNNFALIHHLTAKYEFNANADDSSGNGHNGQLGSLPDADAADPTLINGYAGNSNSAYSFDGVDDFIDLGTMPELGDKPYSANTDPFTICMWVKFDDDSQDNQFLSNATSAAEDNFITLSYSHNGNKKLRIAIKDTSIDGNIRNYYSDNEFQTGEWYFIAIVHSTSSIDIYVNGVNENNDFSIGVSDLGLNKNWYIGMGFDAGAFFTGAIETASFFTEIIRDADIQELYNRSVDK